MLNPQQVNNAIPIVAIVGPTASGKTAFAIALAQALGGPQAVEIISADAMQLYRGMDIGTAKAMLAERAGIAHHQLDVLDVTEEASVAVYQRKARADVAAILGRGRIPLIVGGSGLYVSAILDELDFPGTDPEIRAELRAVAERDGLAPLIAELQQKDPRSAAVIDLANPRRVIRALEVVRLTGRSYTPIFPRHTSHYANVLSYGISAPQEFLDPRIEQRTQDMFAHGLLAETRALIKAGLLRSVTARKATGYAQALAVVRGEISLAQGIEQTAQATRRLAKKQRTWFKADQRIRWLLGADIARALTATAPVVDVTPAAAVTPAATLAAATPAANAMAVDAPAADAPADTAISAAVAAHAPEREQCIAAIAAEILQRKQESWHE